MQPESEENGQKVDVGNTRFVLDKLFNFHFGIKSHFDVEFSGGKISVPRQDANVSYEIKNGQPVFSLRRSPRKLAPHLVKHFFKSKYGCPFVSNSATFSYGLFQNIQSSQAAHPPLDKASSLSFPPRPTPPCLNTSSYSRETFGSAKTFSTPCFKQSRI